MFEEVLEDRKSMSTSGIKILEGCEFNPEIGLMPTNGNYENQGPSGAIVHYTAGNPYANIRDVVQMAKDRLLCFFFIDYAGNIHQQFDLRRWGWHAGKSLCPKYRGGGVRKSVSRHYVGIEVASFGKLTFENGLVKTWWGKVLDPLEFEYRKVGDSYWHCFNKQQEEALEILCAKLAHEYKFPSDFIMGHEEVSPDPIYPGGKEDPGHCLSVSMDTFRERVAAIVRRRDAKGAW